MTPPGYGDETFWTGHDENYEPHLVPVPFSNRTVRNAPPGDVWEASPLEIPIGDWLVVDEVAYAITNMFSPSYDSSVKTLILRGHAPRVVETRHEIVRPCETSHRDPRRAR